MPDPLFALLVVIVIVALVFDFINGFHDAANSIATVVSTRVLSPGWPCSGPRSSTSSPRSSSRSRWRTRSARASSRPTRSTEYVILAGLVGAIVWDLITWCFGLPTSSSHALIGGFAGAAIATGRLRRDHLRRAGPRRVVSMFALAGRRPRPRLRAHDRASPGSSARATPRRVDRFFRKLQLVSAGLYSLGHGGNDAQKTMGIIAILVYTYQTVDGQAPADIHVALWIILACHAAIALGTLSGGWRIVKTMGTQDHQAQAGRRLLRRDGGRRHALRQRLPRASRSRPPTPSPARSSASARRTGSRRCAGASRHGSSGPGC